MTAREFLLPDIGEGLVEVRIIQWLVSPGGEVALDEPLVEVETDKTVTEIPSPFAGTVLRHGAAEGEVLPVGSTLVVIGEGDASEPEPTPGTEPGTAEDAPIVGSLAEASQELAPLSPAPAAPADRPAALPLVRKLAKQLGVDLARVAGTGRDGRITREDVEAAARPGGAGSPGPRSVAPGTERRPLSRMRQVIATSMLRSWTEIPQVTAFDEVDATRLLAVRSALQGRHNVRIAIDALLVAAVVPALQAVPEFNAAIDGDHLLLPARQNVGFAVDTPEGLLVAVVRDAASLNVLQVAAEVRRLQAGARTRSLAAAEASGQTFTVSNIGGAGGGYGTPLVPPGTAAILSVGRAKERPVARGGRIEIAPVMPLSLSFDHRIADGADGRRFLGQIAENLTEPALFLS
jgi:pyruvate dehydrogenase E2 component (dihydrolipoyllysine-residue acetyltransferase)